MRKCECCESRKNYLYESEVKSPALFNGQSAAKARIEQSSTTIPYGSRLQVIGSRSGVRPNNWDKDMVCTLLKNKGFNKPA